MRKCGDCQLCCKLLPVRELGKDANTRCQHQRTGKGCMVYDRPEMPPACRLWNCRWLTGDRSAGLSRPDRSGYVIDIMPDFVQAKNELSGELTSIPVLQVWVDPARPDAWRKDRAFIEYVARLGRDDGMAALIRNGSKEAIFLAPPAINSNGEWFESGSTLTGPQHTPEDYEKAGFSMEIVMEGM